MWAYCWTKFFTLNNESIESSKWEGQHASLSTHWGLLHGHQQTHCSENMNGWSRTASCRVVKLVCVLHQRSHQELCRGLVHLVAWQLDIGDARCCLGDRVRGCMNLHARQNSGTAACNHHSWISPVSPYLPSAACPPKLWSATSYVRIVQWWRRCLPVVSMTIVCVRETYTVTGWQTAVSVCWPNLWLGQRGFAHGQFYFLPTVSMYDCGVWHEAGRVKSWACYTVALL